RRARGSEAAGPRGEPGPRLREEPRHARRARSGLASGRRLVGAALQSGPAQRGRHRGSGRAREAALRDARRGEPEGGRGLTAPTMEAPLVAWYAARVMLPWLRALVAAATLAAATLVAVTARAEPLALPELAERIKPSVAHLTAFVGEQKIGTGTGFFVADGRLVTNHHVIAKAPAAAARPGEGREPAGAGVLAAGPGAD